jgi:hypothetical protein
MPSPDGVVGGRTLEESFEEIPQIGSQLASSLRHKRSSPRGQPTSTRSPEAERPTPTQRALAALCSVTRGYPMGRAAWRSSHSDPERETYQNSKPNHSENTPRIRVEPNCNGSTCTPYPATRTEQTHSASRRCCCRMCSWTVEGFLLSFYRLALAWPGT